MNYLIFDLEIKRAVRHPKDALIDGIAYSDGWQDFANMGISVLCAYDSKTQRNRVFFDDNKKEFAEYISKGYVFIGFNSHAFDAKVVEASWGYKIPEESHYDILAEIWIANGLDPKNFNWKTHGGFGLDAVCKANELGGKTGNGFSAPIDWQQGRIGSVVDYCLEDVRLTSELYRLIDFGGLVNPKTRAMMAICPAATRLAKQFSESEPED